MSQGASLLIAGGCRKLLQSGFALALGLALHREASYCGRMSYLLTTVSGTGPTSAVQHPPEITNIKNDMAARCQGSGVGEASCCCSTLVQKKHARHASPTHPVNVEITLSRYSAKCLS